MSKAIFIYDNSGKIWHWSVGDDAVKPDGLPYIVVENYDSARPLECVDITQNPPLPIYSKTKEELEYETMSLDEYKEKRQAENKAALATFLKNNPITWIDGCLYGVTQEDQNEMSLDLSTYQLKKSLGDSNWKLLWHPVKSDSREFTETEFINLLNAIIEFVYPYRQLEMQYKEAIYPAATKEEIAAINIAYDLGMTILY